MRLALTATSIRRKCHECAMSLVMGSAPPADQDVCFSGKNWVCFQSAKRRRRKERIMLDVSTFAYNSEAPFELTVLSEQVKDGERIQFVSVQDGEYYFELASEPKQIAWYE